VIYVAEPGATLLLKEFRAVDESSSSPAYANLFAMLKSYFDGSKAAVPECVANSLTLADYVASDNTWRQFEAGCWEILNASQPMPAYLHMRGLINDISPAYMRKNPGLGSVLKVR